jgi:hypothetical protein
MDLGLISRHVVALMLGLWRRARNRISLELPTVRAHDLTTSYRIAAPATGPFDSIYFTVSCGSEGPGFFPELANQLSCFIFRRSSVLPAQCWDINNKKFWKELIAYVSWCDTDNIENNAFNNSSIVVCVFVAEPLPRNQRDIHINTQTDGRDLCSTPLRWAQVPWYTHLVS